MPDKRVFLCHSSADKPFVDRLATELTQMNVGVWYDKWEIKVGDSILAKISEGIESHDYLVIVLSKNSVQSDWVRLELNAGLMKELENKEVFVLPILLESCEIPIFLKEKRRADFIKSYDAGFEELLFKIFPDSNKTITRTKEFRNAQYLISGLAASDNNGTNTLNETQFRFIFKFRNELKTWLGPEEKRLLFWSAVGFKYANRNTPEFLLATTPVWCFTEDVDDLTRADWILEGINGVLFDFLAPYYKWANKTLGQSGAFEFLKAGKIREEERENIFGLGPMDPRAREVMLKVYAWEEPSYFNETILKHIATNLKNPHAPLMIEVASLMKEPWPENKFEEFIDKSEDLYLGAFKGLVNIKSSKSVKFLKKRIKSKGLESGKIDEAFELLGASDFVDELKDWLENENDAYLRTRILVTLTNAGIILQEDIFKTIKKSENHKEKTIFSPTLLRLLGRTNENAIKILEVYLESRDPILVEAATFSYARLRKGKCFEKLKKFLKSKSNTIIAATIEVLAKYCAQESYPSLKSFSEHSSQLVRSAFYKALEFIKPPDWENFIDISCKDTDPFVRICACRTFANLASQEKLVSLFYDERFGILEKAVFDEKLFARHPFLPEWLTNSEQFAGRMIDQKYRLTSLDTDFIHLKTLHDLARSVYIMVWKDET